MDGRYFNTQQEMDDYYKSKYGAPTGKYPISGTVAIYGNGTAVSSLTVEIYVPASGRSYTWEMVESQTTAATTGAFTTTNGFNVGQRIMIHVVRSGTKYVYDRWTETLVPPKAEGLGSSPIGTIWVYAYPLAAGHLTLALYTGTGSAVSTTLASPTSLSKAGQASNFQGYAQLSCSDIWTTFGQDPWHQPSTSKAYEDRDYNFVITVATNITGITWKDASYTRITVTSGIKYAKIVKATEFSPNILATDSSVNKRITISMWFDMSALADNTGVQVTVTMADCQLWSNILDSSNTATIGVNVGYTYLKSATFEIKIVT